MMNNFSIRVANQNKIKKISLSKIKILKMTKKLNIKKMKNTYKFIIIKKIISY